jgi:hypothetical protein
MRALIAHRRLVTDTRGQQLYELAIGIRNFACFNGFNEPQAFTKKNDPENVSMVTQLDGRFGNRPEDWLTSNAERSAFVSGRTTGHWECVGIGWLYNGARPDAQGPLAGRQITPNCHVYDWNIGNALRREGFMRRYYDQWNGLYQTTIRQLTPMEEYLSTVFSGFEREDPASVPTNVQQSSTFAAAVHHNSVSAGCLYQFVGSERPAGQAVAFLQTFRNVSEVQYSGWVGANLLKFNFILSAWARINKSPNSTESVYPLMDHLVNYGTDNAITCYAGAGVMMHAMRYGFWSLAEFFNNTNSMVIEGRYNKGAQSSNLSSKYNRACERRGVTADYAAIRAIFNTLKNTTTHAPADVASMVSYERISRAVQTNAVETFINNISARIREVARSDQSPQIVRLVEMARQYGDARLPPEPVTRPAPPPVPAQSPVPTQGAAQSATPRNTTAGAAIGFTQWTSTAAH